MVEVEVIEIEETTQIKNIK